MPREQPSWVHEQRRTLGRRIRDLRTQKGHTQEVLVEMTDIDRRTFQRIEAGTSDPRYGDLLRIAAALQVPLVELVK
ncbi:helix-turn-helix domain-containing protein [Streptomyces sp. NBC_01268]|uniref:helix-turn-helix domain-containing protein n=1 Tax=Streptomyces sp. NBC_01268 TaxID=2903806 RepID=UPI002E35490F|nr:helix-turn-helix transcriptional regulator [Streptomyces sp. NBC_01268]